MALFKKIAFLILTASVLVIAGCTSGPKKNEQDRSVAGVSTPRIHYIVSMHGYNGDEYSYSKLGTVLLGHLKELRPETEFRYIKFSYPTTKEAKSIFEYSYNNFDKFLHESIPQITDQDQITLVSHSQGTLIPVIWLWAHKLGHFYDKEYVQYKSEYSQKLAEQVESVITVAGVYWGSNQVELAKSLGLLNSKARPEAEQLQFNSDMSKWFRETALNMNSEEIDRLKSIRNLNIAAILPRTNKELVYSYAKNYSSINKDIENLVLQAGRLLRPYSFSSEKINSRRSDRFESDLVSILPSQRTAFIGQEVNLNCEQNPLDYKEFNLFPRTNYVLVEAMHTYLVKDVFKSVARVPEFCSDPTKCDHPSYRYILEHISDCSKYRCNESAKNVFNQLTEAIGSVTLDKQHKLTQGYGLQRFTLSLNIPLPQDYDVKKAFGKLNRKDIRRLIKIKNANNVETYEYPKDINFEYKILKRKERFSGLICHKMIDNEVCNSDEGEESQELRVHVTGFAKLKKKHMQLPTFFHYLPVELKLPSDKKYKEVKRRFQVVVKPALNTYLKVSFGDTSACGIEKKETAQNE